MAFCKRDKTARMLNYFLNALFLERIVYQDRSASKVDALSDEEFAQEVAEMAHAYLITEDR